MFKIAFNLILICLHSILIYSQSDVSYFISGEFNTKDQFKKNQVKGYEIEKKKGIFSKELEFKTVKLNKDFQISHVFKENKSRINPNGKNQFVLTQTEENYFYDSIDSDLKLFVRSSKYFENKNLISTKIDSIHFQIESDTIKEIFKSTHRITNSELITVEKVKNTFDQFDISRNQLVYIQNDILKSKIKTVTYHNDVIYSMISDFSMFLIFDYHFQIVENKGEKIINEMNLGAVREYFYSSDGNVHIIKQRSLGIDSNKFDPNFLLISLLYSEKDLIKGVELSTKSRYKFRYFY